jgi:hypothetical protein
MLRFRVYNLGLLFSVKDLGGYVCTLRFKVYGLGGVFFFLKCERFRRICMYPEV